MKGEIEMKLFDYEYDYKFEYMMLSRLEMDCKYFLGYGNKNKRQLRDGSITSHIEYMKELYNKFPKDKKPEWITLEDIEEYEKEMRK